MSFEPGRCGHHHHGSPSLHRLRTGKDSRYANKETHLSRVYGALGKKLRTFANLPWFVVGWLGPVWAMLGVAALAIAVIPFRRLASILGNSVEATPVFPELTRRQMDRVDLIRTTIGIAARYAPFRSNCYPQALVAATMCRFWRLPYAMYFGLASETTEERLEPTFRAHVWLMSGRKDITGGSNSLGRFKIVACFASVPTDGGKMGQVHR